MALMLPSAAGSASFLLPIGWIDRLTVKENEKLKSSVEKKPTKMQGYFSRMSAISMRARIMNDIVTAETAAIE